MRINVSPDEYLQILDVADQASRTIDGHYDEFTWCDGVARILNMRTADLIHLLGPGPHQVIIHYEPTPIDRFHSSQKKDKDITIPINRPTERCMAGDHDWIAHPVKRLYICVNCGAQRTT